MGQQQQIVVDGVDVFIEGQGPQTMVMIHGWPDTHLLWDAQVAALSSDYRCVRFTLPGYDTAKPARPMSLDQIVAFIGAVLDAVSPGQAVVLMLHDWGCVFGYQFIARHPERVQRIIGVDIGDTNSGALARSLTLKAKLGVAFYQLWLALAWVLGRHLAAGLGTRMTRWMARTIGCRSDESRMGWQMNYPYYIQWTGAMGSYRGSMRFAPQVPMLYIFGRRKPFMFHSPQWLDQLNALPGCAVREFATGHWVMSHQPQAFNECVREWLAQGEVAS